MMWLIYYGSIRLLKSNDSISMNYCLSVQLCGSSKDYCVCLRRTCTFRKNFIQPFYVYVEYKFISMRNLLVNSMFFSVLLLFRQEVFIRIREILSSISFKFNFDFMTRIVFFISVLSCSVIQESVVMNQSIQFMNHSHLVDADEAMIFIIKWDILNGQ